MLYEVVLSQPETDALATLVGQQLDYLATDWWSAEIQTPHTIIAVEPEEVSTPDEEHTDGEVERPRVQLVTERKPSLVLYTRGYFIKVSLDGIPKEEWVEFGAFSRRQV